MKPELYFVTQIKIKTDTRPLDTRCIGFYELLKDARNTVKKCSLSEGGFYQYAVIEQFGQGWYPNTLFEEWYDLRKRVKKISKPKRYKIISGFGIG